MKMMFFSDVHLGTYRYPIRQHIVNAMQQVADIADRERPDFIVFCGDAFRYHVPSAGDVAEFGEFISYLTIFAPVLMVPGNHDIAGGGATTLDVYRQYKNVSVYKEPTIFPIGKDGAWLMCIPWLPQKSVAGSGDTKGAIELLLHTLRAQVPDGAKCILAAHCTALGTEFSDGMPTTLGQDVLWPSDWFDGFEFAALGHIHKNQSVPGTENTHYIGSVCPVSFNETGQQKYVMFWDDGMVSWQTISTPNFVQMRSGGVALSFGVDELSLDPNNTFLQIVKEHDAPDPEVPPCLWHEIITLPPKRDRQQRLGEDAATLSPVDAIKAYLASIGEGDKGEGILSLLAEIEEV